MAGGCVSCLNAAAPTGYHVHLSFLAQPSPQRRAYKPVQGQPWDLVSLEALVLKTRV